MYLYAGEGFKICQYSRCTELSIWLILPRLEIKFLGGVRVRNTADLYIGGIPSSLLTFHLSLFLLIYIIQPSISGGSKISQGGCANLLFGKMFAENCMKIKEIEQRRPTSIEPPLDPPLIIVLLYFPLFSSGPGAKKRLLLGFVHIGAKAKVKTTSLPDGFI